MSSSKLKTELVVIGGSAGSLQVILELLKSLETPLSFPIIIVVHRKNQNTNILPILLQQYSPIKVIEVEDKTDLQNNIIYVAPSDYHLLFENKKIISLDGSEKLNYSRPSIDIIFQSAAESFGENLVAILLSGANADGVEGLQVVKSNKGTVWIQDPDTAEINFMPAKAIENVYYDLIITPENFAEQINNLNKINNMQ